MSSKCLPKFCVCLLLPFGTICELLQSVSGELATLEMLDNSHKVPAVHPIPAKHDEENTIHFVPLQISLRRFRRPPPEVDFTLLGPNQMKLLQKRATQREQFQKFLSNGQRNAVLLRRGGWLRAMGGWKLAAGNANHAHPVKQLREQVRNRDDNANRTTMQRSMRAIVEWRQKFRVNFGR